MRVFILEDDQARIDLFWQYLQCDVTVAKDCESGKDKFSKYQPFDIILLDHDLEDVHYIKVGEEDYPIERTGAEFCNWLIENGIKGSPKIIIHSWNPSGRARMSNILRDGGYQHILQVFGPHLLTYLNSRTENESV